jgi:S-adenosylhomocysteine hydrolase
MSSLAGKKVVVIGAGRSERGYAAAFRVADWLGLAAAPTFAIMALLTAFDGSQQDMLCAAMQHASPLGGMIPMYLLMSAFHSAPWLKLISRW